MPDLDKVTAQVVAAGVPQALIRRTHDPLYDYPLEVLRLELDDDAFAAVDLAALAVVQLSNGYLLRMATEEQERALAVALGEVSRARDRVTATRALREAGGFDDVPRYRDGDDFTAFVHRLEEFCGYAPGQALQVVEGAWLLWNNPFVLETAVAAAEGEAPDRFLRLKQVVDAFELQRYFYGNKP